VEGRGDKKTTGSADARGCHQKIGGLITNRRNTALNSNAGGKLAFIPKHFQAYRAHS